MSSSPCRYWEENREPPRARSMGESKLVYELLAPFGPTGSNLRTTPKQSSAEIVTDLPTLSVVVCSFNGATKLVPCFDALVKQRMPVDVLVVDDGSTDATSTLAKSFGFSVVRHESNRGISVARNTGLQSTNSTIVAYCDDDCTPPRNWTEAIMEAWSENSDATVIGGMVEVDHPFTFTQRYLSYRNPLVPGEIDLAHRPSVWYRLRRQFRPPSLPTDRAFPVYSVVGANMTIHRIRTLGIGGFDENLVFGEGEEMSLCVAVRKSYGEGSVLVDPRIVLAHRFDASMRRTWRRSFTYGRGAGERWRKQRGWPSLPVVGPSAVAAALITTPISWPVGLTLGLAMLGVPYGFWMAQRTTKRKISSLAFPIVALADDLIAIFGFVRGLSEGAGRNRRSSRSQGRSQN